MRVIKSRGGFRERFAGESEDFSVEKLNKLTDYYVVSLDLEQEETAEAAK